MLPIPGNTNFNAGFDPDIGWENLPSDEICF